MRPIIFTICVPTYNSAKTLRYTLDSINNQVFNLAQVEVLIVDGGSTDKTLEIAKEYSFTRILHNEKRLPEYAKQIGLVNAKGVFFIKMDSDEAFSSVNALRFRRSACMTHADIPLIVADKLEYPGGYGFAGLYLNKCGDPFTQFMYRQKDGVVETYKKNIVASKYGVTTFSFGKKGRRPIADGGTTTVDMTYLRNNFGDRFSDVSFVSSMSDIILDDVGKCFCVNSDNVIHRSRSTVKSYFQKLRFRVVNNVFSPKESGFSNRSISSDALKYLFPLYTLSTVLPVVDGMVLSIKYKSATMMMHPVYCFYTCGCIVWYKLVKLMGIKKRNKQY